MTLPSEYIIQYHKVDAAVPPPDHSEFAIELTGETGKLSFWPDYSGGATPCWISDFKISLAVVSELLVRIHEIEQVVWIQNKPPRIGGAMEWLEIQEDSRCWKVPPDLCPEQGEVAEKIYHQIRGLVPREIWEEMQDRKQKYITSNYG